MWSPCGSMGLLQLGQVVGKVSEASKGVNREGHEEDAFVNQGLEVDVGHCLTFGS